MRGTLKETAVYGGYLPVDWIPAIPAGMTGWVFVGY